MRDTDCMADQRRPATEWAVVRDGYSLGRYRITSLEPRRWQLTVAGRARSEHVRASEALAEARKVEQARRRNRRVLGNSAVVVSAIAAFLVLLPLRMVANDEYAPTRAFVERMETLYRSVRSGQQQIVDAAELDDQFTGAGFTVRSPIDLGGGSVTREYEMLVGSHNTDCFVIYWTPGRGPFFGILVPVHTCAPAEELTQSGLYVRYWSGLTPESSIDWDAILPPAEIQARWFLPVLFGVMILVLEGCVGVTLALIRSVVPGLLLSDLPAGIATVGSPASATPTPRARKP